MEFVQVQVCRTTEGWSPVRVSSSSDPQINHLVLVNPYVAIAEFVCDCRGFEFRGYCQHQKRALGLTCWWPLGAHRQEQNELEAKAMECPNCGGPTKWEVVNAEEA